MPPAPQLSDYETAANAIYQPQEQAEQIADQATDTTTKATLEAEAPQIQTNYTSAIDTLTNSVQDQTAKISQLYATNLSGNFSGLEGNDMGQLFTRANQQEGIIASTEANQLTQLTTEEGNADVTYEAQLAALTPKYQSLESQYAESSYGSAVSAYNTQEYQQQELGLDYAKLGVEEENDAVSQSNSATSNNNEYLDQFKATAKSSYNPNTKTTSANTANGFAYSGPNGATLNLGQYASALGQGNDDETLSIVENQLSKSGTSTDKNALTYLGELKNQNFTSSAILNALSNNKEFSADFAGM